MYFLHRLLSAAETWYDFFRSFSLGSFNLAEWSRINNLIGAMFVEEKDLWLMHSLFMVSTGSDWCNLHSCFTSHRGSHGYTQLHRRWEILEEENILLDTYSYLLYITQRPFVELWREYCGKVESIPTCVKEQAWARWCRHGHATRSLVVSISSDTCGKDTYLVRSSEYKITYANVSASHRHILKCLEPVVLACSCLYRLTLFPPLCAWGVSLRAPPPRLLCFLPSSGVGRGQGRERRWFWCVLFPPPPRSFWCLWQCQMHPFQGPGLTGLAPVASPPLLHR